MKVLKNYAYNLSYQLLVIILPIITTPYVTRVFSSADLGTYGYFNSIVTYFILLATLGVANYVQKKFQAIVKISEKTFGAYTPCSLVRPFCRYVYTFSYVCPCHLCKIPLHIFWA